MLGLTPSVRRTFKLVNIGNVVKKIVRLSLSILPLTGCATAVSRDRLTQVDPELPLAAVVEAPADYHERVILISGSILGVNNDRSGSALHVLAYPSTRSGRPDLSEPAIGRFILTQPGFLDPLVYQRGRQVAAVGPVVGQQAVGTGETTRIAPLVRPLELNLLDEPNFYLPFHVGFGLQFGF